MLLKKEILENNKILKAENKKLKEEVERLIISLQAQEELTMNEHIKVERLNNIINELEKTLIEWHEYWEDDDSYSWQYKNAYDYLQELKGSDKE